MCIGSGTHTMDMSWDHRAHGEFINEFTQL